jgi:hypothetical protein
MPKKINYSQVEGAFDRSLQKLAIDNLSELASIASAIQNPDAQISGKAVEEIISRFQKELKRLKKGDPKLYEKLSLSPEDEEKLGQKASQFVHQDWLRIKELKLAIDELKKELYGEEALSAEDEAQVKKERKRHLNKRFNIRDGWLPLH